MNLTKLKQDNKTEKTEVINKLDCTTCQGKCCESILIKIDTPESLDDIYDFKWYIYHDMEIQKDNDGLWYVHIIRPCTKLDKNGKCTVYQHRPPLCKDYHPDECCENAETVIISLKTEKDVDEFITKLKMEGYFDKTGKLIKSIMPISQ